MKAKSIANKARQMMKGIGIPKLYSQINLFPRHDGSAHIEDMPDGKFRYVYTERGEEYQERITDDPEDILFWILQDAIWSTACKWEVENRIEDQDFRILMFQKQYELFSKIDKRFAERNHVKNNKLLNGYLDL